MSQFDKQIGGSHYQKFAIQPTVFLQANQEMIGWCEGNAIKYACRHKFKNGKQDIEKAIHYLQMVLEQDYPEEKECPEKPLQSLDEVWACLDCGVKGRIITMPCSSCGSTDCVKVADFLKPICEVGEVVNAFTLSCSQCEALGMDCDNDCAEPNCPTEEDALAKVRVEQGL